VSNFDQYTGPRPVKKGKAPLTIDMSLETNWDQLPDTHFTITMVQMREALRTIGIKGNPAKVKLNERDHPQAYAIVMSYAHSSTEHVAKFDHQAAVRKQDLANRKIIARARETLISLGITVN